MKRRKKSPVNSGRSYGGEYYDASYAVALKTMKAYELDKYYRELERFNRKRPRMRMKRKPETIFKDVGQTKARFSGYVVFTLLLVFVCMLVLALSCAALYSQSQKIAGLNDVLRQKMEDNAVLESEISRSYDLKEIERIATTKLGMAKPKEHQIIHIYVPKQSYVVQVEQEEQAAQSESVFDVVKHFFTAEG